MKDIKIKRLETNPIIYPEMDSSLGENITGPSLIYIPRWIEEPLGKYYLYFASHKGTYIRLAFSESLEGPWKIYKKGTLHLNESLFPSVVPELKIKKTSLGENIPHVASPDVHVMEDSREIRMYYHGLESDGRQVSRVARSKDGIHFQAEPEILSPPYLRIFQYNGYFYGMCMPGIFYRSVNGLTNFERGPMLFSGRMRHSAVRVHEDQLEVYWTRVKDSPERILLSKIKLSQDWWQWKASEPLEILRPEENWEGANLPVEPSKRGPVNEKVCQLRDPEIYEENNKIYLLYVVAGEKGIAIAEIIES
ncbi:MAG: hypothetical protein ACTSVE_04670 [Candidatus Helarchaeota archaeon]